VTSADYGVSHEETRAALREAVLLLRHLKLWNVVEKDRVELFEARHRRTLDTLDPPESIRGYKINEHGLIIDYGPQFDEEDTL